MNGFANTAVRLFGIFWLVRGISSCATSMGDFFRFESLRKSADWLDYVLMWSVGAISVLVFSILPAILLIAWSQRLTDRLFPEAPAEARFDASATLVVGSTLLSFFFMFEGGALLVAGLVMTAAFHLHDVEAARYFDYGPFDQLVMGAIELILGWLLYRCASARAAALISR